MVDVAGTVATTEKRRRAKNWETHEILLLVQAKKEEWERHELTAKLESAAEKWAKVVEFLHRKGAVDRDTDQCRGKWDNLLSDYKTIRDWRKTAPSRMYTSLTRDEKKFNNLPACFDPQVMDLLETFQGKKPASCLLLLTTESSDTHPPEPQQDDEEEARHQTEEPPSGRKKKKKTSDLASALNDFKESYFSTVISIEKRKDKRHAKSLELKRERLRVEREDRRELLGVLGEVAKAFNRIAEKI